MSKWFFPLRPTKNYKIDAVVLDQSYYRRFGAVHTGYDWNGVGGGNTDLGLPINTIGDGWVVSAGWYPVWGNIVLIYHPSADIYSQYAHCDRLFVKPKQWVKGGQKIGTIGRGAGNKYIAHLHFEIRVGHKGDVKRRLSADFWPSTTMGKRQAELFIEENYVINHMALFKKFNASRV